MARRVLILSLIVVACLGVSACGSAPRQTVTSPPVSPSQEATSSSDVEAIRDAVSAYITGLLTGDVAAVKAVVEESADWGMERKMAFGSEGRRLGASARLVSAQVQITNPGRHPQTWTATATIQPSDEGQPNVVVRLSGYNAFGGVKVTSSAPVLKDQR